MLVRLLELLGFTPRYHVNVTHDGRHYSYVVYHKNVELYRGNASSEDGAWFVAEREIRKHKKSLRTEKLVTQPKTRRYF